MPSMPSEVDENMPTPTRTESAHHRSQLEEYERSGEGRPPYILTYTEVKLLGIAGVSFYQLMLLAPLILCLARWASFWMVRAYVFQ